MEENAAFPLPTSPVSVHIGHATGSLKDTKESVTYGNFSKFPTSSELSQNIGTQTIPKKDVEEPADHHGENHSFTTSRPQEAEFRYGQYSTSKIAFVKEEIKNKLDCENVKS